MCSVPQDLNNYSSHCTLRTSVRSSKRIDCLITVMQMMYKFVVSADLMAESSLNQYSSMNWVGWLMDNQQSTEVESNKVGIHVVCNFKEITCFPRLSAEHIQPLRWQCRSYIISKKPSRIDQAVTMKKHVNRLFSTVFYQHLLKLFVVHYQHRQQFSS